MFNFVTIPLQFGKHSIQHLELARTLDELLVHSVLSLRSSDPAQEIYRSREWVLQEVGVVATLAELHENVLETNVHIRAIVNWSRGASLHSKSFGRVHLCCEIPSSLGRIEKTHCIKKFIIVRLFAVADSF